MKGAFLLLLGFIALASVYGKTISETKSTAAEGEECSQLVDQIKTVINDNKPMMKRIIKNVCKYIPNMSCEEYEEKIFNFSPNEMETKHLCKSYSRGRQIGMRMRECFTGEKYCPYLCKRCNKVVAILNRVIKVMNVTAGDIETGITTYCKAFKLDDKTCETITEYFNKAVQMIIDEISPGDICVELKFCNSSSDGNVMDGFKNYMKNIHGRGRHMMKHFKKSYGKIMKGVHESLKDLHSRRHRLLKYPIFKLGGRKSFPNFFRRKHWGKQLRKHHVMMQKMKEQMRNMFMKIDEVDDDDDESPMTTITTPVTKTTMEPEIIEENDDDTNESDDDDVMDQDGFEVMGEDKTNPELNKVIQENPYLAYDFGGFGNLFKETIKEHGDLPTEELIPEDLSLDDWEIDSMADKYDPSQFGNIKGLEKIVPFKIEELYGYGDEEETKEEGEEEEDPLRGLLPTFEFPSVPESFSKEMDKMMLKVKEELETVAEKTSELTPPITKLINLKEGIGCTVCKVVVGVIEYEIKTVNASIEEIEKVVKGLCKLYPIEAAKNACLTIVKDIDEIVQLIEKDVDPKDICVDLKLCPAKQEDKDGFKTEVTTYVKPTGDCNAMCDFWKTIYGRDVSDVMELWVETKERIVKLCQNSKYKTKCFGMLRTFGKAESQLGSVLTSEGMNRPNKTDKTCKCFKSQPIFVTKKTDDCQLCRQMEKGLSKDISNTKESINYLIKQLNVFCDGISEHKEECSDIIDIFETSFADLDKRMEATGLCNKIGYCVDDGRESSWKKIMEEMMTRVESLLPSFWGGGAFGSAHSCNFCKTCMENIDDTMKVVNINSTNIEEKTPVLKDGFAIFCRSQKYGDEITQVCKRIYNGMETIQKSLITKKEKKDGSNEDMSTICKEFDMC